MRNSQDRSVVVRRAPVYKTVLGSRRYLVSVTSDTQRERAFVKQVPATQRPPQPAEEFRPRLYVLL